MRLQPVTEHERAFCRHYHATGKAAESYAKAGYSRHGAKQGASRPLGRKEVREELKRLTVLHDKTVDGLLTNSVRLDVGQTVAEAIQADKDAVPTSAWVTQRHMLAVQMAMGEIPTPQERGPAQIRVDLRAAHLHLAALAEEARRRDAERRIGARDEPLSAEAEDEILQAFIAAGVSAGPRRMPSKGRPRAPSGQRRRRPRQG